MEDIASWVAPATTMIAAMMTAANLGARVTGYGFIVFSIGSICWTFIGLSTGQPSLVVSNGFLTLVNIVGIWRWLGRQARFEHGSKEAAMHSARAAVPSLFSAASLVGSKVIDTAGMQIGRVVDAMLHCSSRDLAYVVMSKGGVAGVGDVLHAIDPACLSFGPEAIVCNLDAKAVQALPILDVDEWPEALPRPRHREPAGDGAIIAE